MPMKCDEQNSRRDSKWLLIECLQNQTFFHWNWNGNRCGAIFNTNRLPCVWAIKHLISNRLTRGKWLEGEHKGNKKNKNFFLSLFSIQKVPSAINATNGTIFHNVISDCSISIRLMFGMPKRDKLPNWIVTLFVLVEVMIRV